MNLQLSFNLRLDRGPGFWKFPIELLANPEFVSAMNEFLGDWEPPAEITSHTTIWEWLKHEMKSFTRSFLRTHKGEEKALLEQLKVDLSSLTSRRDMGETDLTVQIDSIVRQIREIEESRARRTIFRSRTNWSLYGEKPTYK